MDAKKILTILEVYRVQGNYVSAAMELIEAGCTGLEASALLMKVDAERPKVLEFDWTEFIETHQEDKAFYKLGTRVRYIGSAVPELEGKEFVIDASNIQDDESTEYHLKEFPYLVWGDEIQPVEVRPDDCRCLDSTFEAYGCMCKRRPSGTEWILS